jgi:condensin complex subunit 1
LIARRFTAAEQAINTIFELAKGPAVLGTKLLQSLTRRVFQEKQSSKAISHSDAPPMVKMVPKLTTSSFDLARVFFVAGHLAVKQIVFLELLEAELKRNKEREQGTYHF